MNAPIHGRLLFLSMSATVALAACGVFSSKDDEAEPAPPIAPVATSDTPGAQPGPGTAAGAATGAGQGVAAPPPVPTPGTGNKPDAGQPVDAGTPTDAGKADAAAPADAGTASAKLKACADKCGAVLASCYGPSIPTDGGFPTIKDPKTCQAAFDACRASCTP
jgi:hypothetical protein